MFPPWKLIPRVLQKIKREKTKEIVSNAFMEKSSLVYDDTTNEKFGKALSGNRKVLDLAAWILS